MKAFVFDIETDGLSPTKIHVFSATANGKNIKSTNDYDTLRGFLRRDRILIAHNSIRYDKPALEKILGINIKGKVVDTLALSWYLEPSRKKHGLADWGVEFGIPKPVIEDWDNLSYEEYKHRCEEDVKINFKLWERLWNKLLTLYEGDETEAWRLIDYLTFKMECAAEQEASKWKLDVEKCEDGLETLTKEKEEKICQLAAIMPKVPKYQVKKRPAKPFKKNGSLSSIGEKWFTLLEREGLPEDYEEEVKVLTKMVEPNPGSVPQIKDWLYSLGWKPETFKFVRNKETGDVKQIPQINLERGAGICKSIKKLYKKEANLEMLDGLSVLTHRISLLKGFMKAVDEEGYVKAEIQGLTNTLRFKHAVCVNLPGIDKPYGELIRGCLIAPDGYELCGADMSSLEDRIKQHLIWKFDNTYVRKMMAEDYDPHLTLAVSAGALTEDQMAAHKGGTENHSAVRKIYKVANYACQYSAGAATVARAAGISKKEGTKLVDEYWKLNWAVRAVPKTIRTKTEHGSVWLFNPISKLWYSLRTEKDIFSTLVQGSGVWAFDTWVKHLLSKRKQLVGQFHDEFIICVKTGYRDKCTELIRWAMLETNKKLNLNRKLDCDIQYGKTYAEVH
jgi:DNA polymerase I-like protein with 3'-5' exonuclease and polymerase domains